MNDVVANPETESTPEDTVLTDNVLTNDTDEDGTILVVQSATVDIDGSGTQVALVLGTATAIEDSTGAPIGNLTLNADGSYTFDPAPDFNGTVPTVNYVVADPDGNIDSTTLDITVDPVNDAPIVSATSTRVSEEGLISQGGTVDAIGSDDTTNNATVTGEITFTDVDNVSISDFNITLTGPSGITVEGNAVTWTWDDATDTLTGQAVLVVGEPATDVMTIEVNDITSNGSDFVASYDVTLLHAIDHPTNNTEDELAVTFSAIVNDGNDDSLIADLVVTVEDDSPLVAEGTVDIVLDSVSSNLSLILDVSGSMNAITDTGETRLEVAKAAMIQLIDAYAEFGDTMVQITLFSTTAETQDAWMTVDEAKTYINSISGTTGVTNYDAALDISMEGFSNDGKIVGAQNYSYFLTDGEPTVAQGGVDSLSGDLDLTRDEADYGIQPNEETIWTDFLTANSIKSYAYTFGSDFDIDAVLPIAYDGQLGVDNDDLADKVDDITELGNILIDSLSDRQPEISRDLIRGNLLSDTVSEYGYGADGGNVLTITIDSTTYTYNATDGSMTVQGDDRSSYDLATTTIAIDTIEGGVVSLNFETGIFEYQARATDNGYQENIAFSVIDNDGDVVSSTQVLNITRNADNDYLVGTNQAETLSGGVGDDTLVGLSGADTLLGGDGNDILTFDKDDVLIDGGEDVDTLVINDTSIVANIDLTNVTNFESINMTNNTAQTLNLGLSDVISMTDTNNELFIKGDAVDTVNVSDMTKSVTSDQVGYDLYQDSASTAKLYIQNDISDNII